MIKMKHHKVKDETYNVRISSCRLRSDRHQGPQDLKRVARRTRANEVDARLIFRLKIFRTKIF